MSPLRRRVPWALIGGLAGLAAITLLFLGGLHIHNAATVSTSFLLVVLLVAASSTLAEAIAVSLAAMLCFNYFFLPPIKTLTIADPQNWVALGAFLVVSVVASNLSARVRARAEEATARRSELARLYDLSRDVLLAGGDDREGRTAIVHAIVRRFELPFVAIATPSSAHDWSIAQAGPEQVDLPQQELTHALEQARRRVEFDAEARTYAGHGVLDVGPSRMTLVPLRVGTRAIGLLATTGGAVEAGTLDAIGGLAAMAIERLQMLEERRQAALLRQSEELKTTLLASLGHDLRTPLTSIRVGVENLRTGMLSDAERHAQAALVVAEAGRLDRLFQNLLEMARLEAGTITADTRRTHPSEVLEAARAQVEAVLAGRVIREDLQADDAVLLDPRLTATALARLLENAAQYTAAGAAIDVATRREGGALVFVVRDHGAGIPARDLPHVFERFYRGAERGQRPSGTGMGLWIARGLLAAQGAQVWAENPTDGHGGAMFTIRIPLRGDSPVAAEPLSSVAPAAGRRP